MREIIADLRGVDADVPETIADHPVSAELVGLLYENAGKVIRIKITVVKGSATSNKENDGR